MTGDTTMNNSDAYETALQQRIATLGVDRPRCGCGETDPFALTGAYPSIVCYECQAEAAGRRRVEQQHVAGRHNRPETVAMLGNDHRVADAYKHIDWPVDTLRNPDGSPLLRAAACVRGWLDLLRLVIDRTVGWVPAFLEHLNTWLNVQLGARWWDGLDFDTGMP
jgi:hypothetical protein